MDACGLTYCDGGFLAGVSALIMLCLVVAPVWKGRNQDSYIPPQKYPPAPPEKGTEEAKKREWNQQVYEATKLIYGEPNYARIFNRYPDERKKQHIEEVAGYVSELLEIDRYIEKLKQMPVEDRMGHEATAEQQVQRKVELLQKVYRKLE